jgi:glycosyltransferase involved in cell wall biosynthesis
MACALPTVATDTPVNRELLGDLGRYAPVGDVAALAGAMVRLLRCPDERAQLAPALRERVETEFSWPALARRLAQVYERVAGRTSSTP